MIPTALRQPLFILSAGLAVAGCDNDRLHTICSNHPELCQDLVDDGWCRYERTDVIRSRFYLQEEQNDRRSYELMRSLERYIKCAEHSTNIEYKRAREQKDRKSVV